MTSPLRRRSIPQMTRFLVLPILCCCLAMSAFQVPAEQDAAPRDTYGPIQQKYYAALSQVPAARREVNAVVTPPNSASASAARSRASASSAAPASRSAAASNDVYATKVQRKFYNATELNSALSTLKGDILKAIPAQDEPLKHYVEARFPRPLSDDFGYVTEGEVARANKIIDALIGYLRS